MDENLIKNISKATKTIRKKYNAIKAGIGERESILEDAFKSITGPLKSIAKETKSKQTPKESTFKEEEEEESEEEEEDFKDAEESFSSIPTSTSLPDQLSNKYLGYLLNESSLLDTVYGVRTIQTTYGGSQRFGIGSSSFEFINDSNDFMIDDELYKGTPGLYQLIFLKYPKAYDKKEDIDEYKKILKRTNVYRRNYKPNGQILGNRSKKYLQIISKLIPKGKGLMQIPSDKYNHIYWNDPNELVSRLQLLYASRAAGNSSHNNEIQAIIEELREADFIF